MTDSSEESEIDLRALATARQERDDALALVEALAAKCLGERSEEQHHLRNFLSVIRSIARRSSDDVDDIDSYCALLEGRLSSYIGVHAAIAGDLRAGTDLEGLIADELLRFTLHVRPGPAVRPYHSPRGRGRGSARAHAS